MTTAAEIGMTRRSLAIAFMALWPAVSAAGDADGDGVEQAWVASYDGPLSGPDWVNDLEVRDGYVYVTGYESAWAGTSSYATVKYDYAGNELWAVGYREAPSQAEALAVDAAGNVYVTGWQYYETRLDVVTLKYSPDGEVLWERRYNSPGGNNQPNDMAIDASGAIYVAGASWVTSQEDFDVLLLKYGNRRPKGTHPQPVIGAENGPTVAAS